VAFVSGNRGSNVYFLESLVEESFVILVTDRPLADYFSIKPTIRGKSGLDPGLGKLPYI